MSFKQIFYSKKILFALVIFFISSIWHFTHASPLSESEQLFYTHKGHVLKFIKRQQYKEAHDYIDSLGLKRPVETALSTVLGNEIFRHKKLKGLSLCFEIANPSTNFGCLRGFLSSAVAQGPSLYPTLYAHCFSPNVDTGMCIHNLGHALVADLGYSSEAIQKALQSCNQFPDPNDRREPYSSCTGGVMMEYYLARLGKNSRGLHDNFKRDTSGLIFNQNSPYDLCPSLNTPQCYSQIVHWWLNDIKLSKNEVASLCLNINDEDNKSVCLAMLTHQVYIEAARIFLYEKSQRPECEHLPFGKSRIPCYQKTVVNPVKPQVIAHIQTACHNLNLGKYYSECVTSGTKELDIYGHSFE